MNSDVPLAFMARSKYQIDHARDKINPRISDSS